MSTSSDIARLYIHDSRGLCPFRDRFCEYLSHRSCSNKKNILPAFVPIPRGLCFSNLAMKRAMLILAAYDLIRLSVIMQESGSTLDMQHT
jgi:hypothetical protein